MTILGLLALGSVGVWLLALTVLLVLVVRQFALLTVRLDTLGQQASGLPQGEDHDVANDGLPVGARVPAEVLEAIPEAADGTAYVLLISALCRSCRLLAADIEDRRSPFPGAFVALVPGPSAAAREIAVMLPPGTRVIHDPVAGTLAQTHLAVRSTPFLFRVERGYADGEVIHRISRGSDPLHGRAPVRHHPDYCPANPRRVGVASPVRKERYQHAHEIVGREPVPRRHGRGRRWPRGEVGLAAVRRGRCEPVRAILLGLPRMRLL